MILTAWKWAALCFVSDRGLEPNCVLDEVIDNLLFDRSACLTKSHGLLWKLRCLFSSKPQFINLFFRDISGFFYILCIDLICSRREIVKKYAK